MRLAVVVPLALALLAVGCGDDDDGPVGPRDAGRDAAADDAAMVVDAALVDAARDAGLIDARVDGSVECIPACGAGSLCDGVSCNAPGMCANVPASCPDEYVPVCGCDGMTYNNDCARMKGGVRRIAMGECACLRTPRANCCFTSSDCTAGRCYAAACTAGQEGVCKVPPATGSCWSNLDCAAGRQCQGAQLCACGTACLVPDSPGTCQ